MEMLRPDEYYNSSEGFDAILLYKNINRDTRLVISPKYLAGVLEYYEQEWTRFWSAKATP